MDALPLPRHLELTAFLLITSLPAVQSLPCTGLLELMIYQEQLKKKSYEVWVFISEQPVVSPMVSQ